MTPETSVLLLWLVLIQEGASFRPVVTFSPNYKKIFTTESITMTCDVEATRGEGPNYIWYKDGNQLHNGKSYSIKNAGTSHSGNYQCQTSTGEISDPARLDVSNGWLILQTPLYVYEGDEMKLRCHHYPGYSGRRTTFYKENKVITDGNDDEEFHISNVDRKSAGKYKCTKEVFYHSLYYSHDDEASVSVKDLFNAPTMKVTPNLIFKKENMTLKCETSLHPSRQNTQLQYAFYREGRVVQEFGDNDIYKVFMVELEHSGKYSCEVQTTNGRVRKKSEEEPIQIQGLVLIQEGASIRPVVTFSPNYKKIFKKESITMICDVEATRGEGPNYIWYKDGNQLHNGKSYQIENAGTSHSGNYRCQTSTGEISDPARLDVSNDWLILQTPLYVYEGDEMKLRCHHYPGYHGRRTRFYKENKVIKEERDDEEFHISNVDRTSTGKYKCTKEVYYHSSSSYEAEASVSVEDLFNAPTMKVTPNPIFKKENMTLKCETSLHPSRQNTQLQYAFYREGRVVQGFGDNDIYEVFMIELEHSGKYLCEVQTTNGRVRKKSAEEPIQIEEPFSNINININVSNEFFEGDPMTLTCNTTLHRKFKELQFAFYKDGWEVQNFTSSNKYTVQSVHQENSGNYTCEIKLPMHATVKTSNWSTILVQELFNAPTMKVTPNPIFKKENMTLKCETSLHPSRQNTQLQYAFYREGRVVQGFGDNDIYEVFMVELEHSGKYSCEVQTTNGRVRKKSAEEPIQIEDPFSNININVSNEFFEGDPMTLTCNTTLNRKFKELQFAFYKDGWEVQNFTSSNKYIVLSVHQENSGNYTCEIKLPMHATVKTSNWSTILVQELFSPPVLKVSPELVNDGDYLILTCDTNLSEHRRSTELQYAFYRDGENIQGFNSSNIYEAQFIKGENSGTYTCEIQGSNSNVTKRSKEVQIEELFSPPVLKVSPELVNDGDYLILTCDTNLSEHRRSTELQYAFYRDEENIQGFNSSNIYEAQFIKGENSGTYTCEIQASNSNVTKRSKEVQIEVSYHSPLMIILSASLGLLLLIVIISIFLYVYIRRGSSNNNPQPTRAAVNKYSAEDQVTYSKLSKDRRPLSQTVGVEQLHQPTAQVPENNGPDSVYAAVSKSKRQV